MWKNILEPRRPQMTMWSKRIASKVTKATDTNSEYESFFAFPLQQWLHKRATVLRYTFSDCIVCSYFNMKN